MDVGSAYFGEFWACLLKRASDEKGERILSSLTENTKNKREYKWGTEFWTAGEKREFGSHKVRAVRKGHVNPEDQRRR